MDYTSLLHGAPATFQCLIDQVVQGCEEWAAAYLADVVIYSYNTSDHVNHLRLTLEKIQQWA